MRCGFSYGEILKMDIEEFHDWQDAEIALEINDRLIEMKNKSAMFPEIQKIVNIRNSALDDLKREQLEVMGQNPFSRNDDLIEKTKNRFKKGKRFSR